MLPFETQEKGWDERWHLVQVTELLFGAWRAWLPTGGGSRSDGDSWGRSGISRGLAEAFPPSAPIHRARSGPFLHPLHCPTLPRLGATYRHADFWTLAPRPRTPEAVCNCFWKVVDFPFFLSLPHFLLCLLYAYYYFLLYSIFSSSSVAVLKFLIRKLGQLKKLIM